MKTKIVLSTILLTIMLLAACRAPLPAISQTDIATETIVPAQATTPTPTPRPVSPPYQPIPGAPPGFTPPPFNPPDTMLTPPIPRKEMPLPKTKEEFDAWSAQRQKELESVGLWGSSSITKAFGPETKGATINIPGKNKTIKLPDDAYITSYIPIIDCGVGMKCPQRPVYGIARGGSRISVDGNGVIIQEYTAQGEENIFDFLKKALQ